MIVMIVRKWRRVFIVVVERVVKKVVNITDTQMQSNREALIRLWCERNSVKVPKKRKPVMVKVTIYNRKKNSSKKKVVKKNISKKAVNKKMVKKHRGRS